MFKDFFTQKPETTMSEDDRMQAALAAFIKEEQFTAAQLREAYFRVCGVAEFEARENSKLEELAKRMREMTHDHYPPSRLAEVAYTTWEYEHSTREYREYVDKLPLSSGEKDVLRSIVDKRRSGKIAILVGGREIGTITIDIRDDMPDSVIAVVLLEKLQEAVAHVGTGKKYEIEFVGK
jgi:hypothetical protein